jgi:uncharacterized membrane protein
MLAQARQLDAQERADVEYRVATAEATGLATASCDAFSAGQCRHWFDRPSAAAEHGASCALEERS